MECLWTCSCMYDHQDMANVLHYTIEHFTQQLLHYHQFQGEVLANLLSLQFVYFFLSPLLVTSSSQVSNFESNWKILSKKTMLNYFVHFKLIRLGEFL